MKPLCLYNKNGEILHRTTGDFYKRRIRLSGISQTEVSKRMRMDRTRLAELLNYSGRYNWSEEIAQAIVTAIK